MKQKAVPSDEKRREAESIFYHLLEREGQARRALEEAEQALLERQNQASHPSADDETVEAFSRWLKTGRQIIAEARTRLEIITLERDLVRQALLREHCSDSSRYGTTCQEYG